MILSPSPFLMKGQLQIFSFRGHSHDATLLIVSFFWFEIVQPCFISHHSVSRLFTSISDMQKVLKKCSFIVPCVNLSAAEGPIGHTLSCSQTAPIFCKPLLLYCTIGVTNVLQFTVMRTSAIIILLSVMSMLSVTSHCVVSHEFWHIHLSQIIV